MRSSYTRERKRERCRVTPREIVSLPKSDDQWKKITGKKNFITDICVESLEATINGEEGDKTIKVSQYAAWVPAPNVDKHQIVEVSQSIEELKKKYKTDLVFKLNH